MTTAVPPGAPGGRAARLRSADWPVAAGLIAGLLTDAVVGDPRRGHPVAAFGQAVTAIEQRMYADSRSRGAAFTATCAVLAISPVLAAGRLCRLPNLCGRDPEHLDGAGIVRAVVESVAENSSDAIVAPLLWGALTGPAGLVGYRAVNTLDAMTGHHSPRYERFGWASARLDDVTNWLPARITALLTAACAPVVGGHPATTWQIARDHGPQHPSPNAGWCEAAFAGALGVRLGGPLSYAGRTEHRPVLGAGQRPEPADIARAGRLCRSVTAGATLLAAAVSLASRDPAALGGRSRS